jgi:hypothetical protein
MSRSGSRIGVRTRVCTGGNGAREPAAANPADLGGQRALVAGRARSEPRDVRQPPRHRGGSHHRGAHQQGAPGGAALAAAEVPVRRGRAPSRPWSLSGFMPRHIEQPGARHSKPAARNVSCRPSRSAASRTACEPGTTSPRTTRRLAQVAEAAVDARPDERHVDARAGNRRRRPVPATTSPPDRTRRRLARTAARAGSRTSSRPG